jgi:glutamate synthase domain-containing protein 2
VLAHMRWMFEGIRPEIRQYLVESDTAGMPFNRDERSLAYQRAKGEVDKKPFGTQIDVYGDAYEWLNHSVIPKRETGEPFRVTIGGPQCARPYSASVFNISAMSFGALSGNAIAALNLGAKMGNFAHDTGEGGISRYHHQGGDLIWEIGSGYFGCRHEDGSFNPAIFAEQALSEQIKMIEVKISQGAKPGHGGVLPAAKVTAEIAAARLVPVARDCVSPPFHSTFANPLELLKFIARLRELAGGKPTGFKLCIGHRWEFLAICKAMLATGILPDFIVVDGSEGGTGTAPLEFADHLGTPLREGLLFVHNALVGIELRDKIKIGASGKVISAFNLAVNMALGADWCNSARGFMFALGCVQAQHCHTNRCPVGVATQDPWRMRALVIAEKARRVGNFHRQTGKALAEVVAAAGLEHPAELRPHHIYHRLGPTQVLSCAQLYHFLEPGELLRGTTDPVFREPWKLADPGRFQAH